MDELIKRLRLAKAVLSRNKDLIALLSEAADAIEELQAYVALYKDGGETAMKVANDYKARIEELSAIREEQKAQIIAMAAEDKPRWIPVSERLPEKTNHYLVHVECGCDGKLVSAWEQVAWFCEKFYWEHLHGDEVFKETITHWMPLPEPPKEE